MSGELTKLKIKAYKDEKFSQEVASGEFNSLLNPENYRITYRIDQNDSQAQGTSSAAPKFNKTQPEDLELEFIFDRSGVIKGYEDESGEGIIQDIVKFKKIVLDYNGDEHKPNYLIITWGSLLFKGSLNSLDITYKLFKPDGTSIRAKRRTCIHPCTGRFSGYEVHLFIAGISIRRRIIHWIERCRIPLAGFSFIPGF